MAFRARQHFLASGYEVGAPGDEWTYIPTEVIGQARTSLLSAGYVTEVPDDPELNKKFYDERGDLLSEQNNPSAPHGDRPGVVPLPYETHSNVDATTTPEDERTEGERVLDPSSAAAGGFSPPTAPEFQHQMDEEGNVDPGDVDEEQKSEQSDQSENDEVDATEGARELAAEEDVDLSKVEGSGQDGRIQKSDVEKYLNEQ